MRHLFIILLSALIVGCTTPAASHCEVGNRGGWTRLDDRPANAEEILANSPTDERILLLNVESVEWFVREDGAYLLCLPGRRPVCGQRNYHVEKADDGWARPFNYRISCP